MRAIAGGQQNMKKPTKSTTPRRDPAGAGSRAPLPSSRWTPERIAKVNAIVPPADETGRGALAARKELKPLGPERAVMTREEAADYLGVSVPTLWRMVRAGEVPHVMVGKRARYRREDLDAYLDGNVRTTWEPTPGRSRRQQ